MYYLKHHFKKTVITILIVCGAALYTVISLSEKGYSIKEVKPTTAGLVNPIGSTFSLMPQLYASNLGGELIQFGGKSYPFAKDTTYEFAKILGEPGILVWNKHLNKVFRIHIPELDDSALRKYAK